MKMSSSVYARDPEPRAVEGESGYNIIWSASSPNLLRTFSDGTVPAAIETKKEKETNVDLGAGPHTFAFSLALPETYKKSQVTGTMISWLKSLMGVGKEKAEAYVETPLPPTTLSHRAPSLWITQYQIMVAVQTGIGRDDYQLRSIYSL